MAEIRIGDRVIPALYVAIGLPVLGALVAAYFFTCEGGVLPRNEEITAREAGLDTLRADVEALKAKVRRIDAVRTEMEDLDKRIALLKTKIPEDAKVPVLLYDVERLAKDAKNSISSFEPGQFKQFAAGNAVSAPDAAAVAAAASPAPDGTTAPAPAAPVVGDVWELPIKIQAVATYPELIGFFDKLNAYERKLAVSELSLEPASESGSATDGVFKNRLKVGFTLSAYVLKAGGPPQ